MTLETCSAERLEAICLDALRPCEGFEDVRKVVVQGRERFDGGANWSVMSLTPKVSNVALRAARPVLDGLQATYRLAESAKGEAVDRTAGRKPGRAPVPRRAMA